MVNFKRFRLVRFQKSNVSATVGVRGTVAEGVQFTDGTAVVHWCIPDMPKSTVVWDNITDAMIIHNYDGGTVLEWVD